MKNAPPNHVYAHRRGWLHRQNRRMLRTIEPIATMLITTLTAVETPPIQPSVGATNGKMTYMTVHRTVEIKSDVCSAFWAACGVEVWLPTRKARRINRSAGGTVAIDSVAVEVDTALNLRRKDVRLKCGEVA